MDRIDFGPARFISAREAASYLGERYLAFNWQRTQRPDCHPPYVKRSRKNVLYWTPHLEEFCQQRLRNVPAELTPAE